MKNEKLNANSQPEQRKKNIQMKEIKFNVN